MTLRLDDRLADLARQFPETVALSWSSGDPPTGPCVRTITYAKLQTLIDRVAGRLRQRFAPGSVVILQCLNEPAYVVHFLAIIRAGLKVFPVTPRIGAQELRQAAGRTAAAALIGQRESCMAAADLPLEFLDAKLLMDDAIPMGQVRANSAPSDPEPGLLLQSSGTTGTPKIVFRDRAALDAVAENVATAAGLSARDRVLAVVQLSHSFGIESAMLAPLWAGATIHLLTNPDSGSLSQIIRDHQISVLPAVPFLFEHLVETGPAIAPDKAARLRLAYSAGAPLPDDVSNAFAKTFGTRIGQLYGATEIGSVTFNHPADRDFDPVAVGLRMAGVSVLILDPDTPDVAQPLPPGSEGHVAVRAPSMFRGYVDAPTTEVLDGYFLTGDLGRLDGRGRLTLTGRLKLLIDVGGIKVNPHEVERVLMQHPQVRECVVVALPVARTVERLKAVVVLRRPDEPFSADDLRAFAAQRLSAYKVPRAVEVAPALPRSAGGKVLRGKLPQS